MRKFYFEDNFDDDEEEEIVENKIDEDQMVMAQIDLFELELNKKILIMAVKICEKSFFWNFYSCYRKLKLIEDSYNKLLKILSEDTQDAQV